MSKRDKADKPRDPPRKVKDEFHQPAGTPNAAPPPAAHEADHKAGEHAKSEPGSRHARRVVELFRHRLREKALPKALALIERTLAVVDENDPLSGWKEPDIPIAVRVECARMVIEHCVGKPKQAIEIEGRPNLALIRIESAQVAVMNSAGKPQHALPGSNGVAH